jgi:hypothetical protein
MQILKIILFSTLFYQNLHSEIINTKIQDTKIQDTEIKKLSDLMTKEEFNKMLSQIGYKTKNHNYIHNKNNFIVKVEYGRKGFDNLGRIKKHLEQLGSKTETIEKILIKEAIEGRSDKESKSFYLFTFTLPKVKVNDQSFVNWKNKPIVSEKSSSATQQKLLNNAKNFIKNSYNKAKQSLQKVVNDMKKPCDETKYNLYF